MKEKFETPKILKVKSSNEFYGGQSNGIGGKSGMGMCKTTFTFNAKKHKSSK